MTRYAPVLSSTSPRHLVSQYPTQPSFHTAPASPSSTSTETSRPIKGSASGSYARLGIATSSAGAPPRALRRALDAPDVQRNDGELSRLGRAETTLTHADDASSPAPFECCS